jgi:hypothetical protein
LGEPSTAKAHARFSPRGVEIALTELLDPQVYDHDTWDLFLTWPINDSYLESNRFECLRICQECPPVPGKGINEEGEKRVAALLAELRRRTIRAPGCRCCDGLGLKNATVADPGGSGLRYAARL